MALPGGNTIDTVISDARLRQGDAACSIAEMAARDMRRGACPTLAAPMMTGDGLLARLRPLNPALTPGQMRGLARAACARGNGLLEITSRGSLQIRGLRPQTVEALSADIAASGIAASAGIMIEVPPLSGVDPDEHADATVMAAALRAAIAALVPAPAVAPKLAIVVDGGGRFNLAGVDADIRLRAIVADDRLCWLVSVGGTDATARRVAAADADDAVDVALSLIRLLARLGPRARGRDITPRYLDDAFPGSAHAGDVAPLAPPPSAVGIHAFPGGSSVLGLRLAFGQIDAHTLPAFLDLAAQAGAKEFRPAPDHGLFITGLTAEKAAGLQKAAGAHGLITRDDDPLNFIATCAGAGACASGFYRTRPLAHRLAESNSSLLDGSLTLHLSGCAKGCAHPRLAAIVVAGTPTGYGLVVNGSASDAADAYTDRDGLHSALDGLDRLVRHNKAAGESAHDCLARLGHDAVVQAARQG